MMSLLSQRVLFGLQSLVAESRLLSERYGRKTLQCSDILSTAAAKDLHVVCGAVTSGEDLDVCLAQEVNQTIAFNVCSTSIETSWATLIPTTPPTDSFNEDLRMYFTAVCKAVLGAGRKRDLRKMALNDVTTNPNIGSLLPRFLATARRMIKVYEQSASATQLMNALELLCAIAHKVDYRIDIFRVTEDIIRQLLTYMLDPASCVHKCDVVERTALTLALLLRKVLPWRRGLYDECVMTLLTTLTKSSPLHYGCALVLASLHTDQLSALLDKYIALIAVNMQSRDISHDLADRVILRVAIRLCQCVFSHIHSGQVKHLSRHGDASTPVSYSVYQQLYSVYGDCLANMLTGNCGRHDNQRISSQSTQHTATKSDRVTKLLAQASLTHVTSGASQVGVNTQVNVTPVNMDTSVTPVNMDTCVTPVNIDTSATAVNMETSVTPVNRDSSVTPVTSVTSVNVDTSITPVFRTNTTTVHFVLRKRLVRRTGLGDVFECNETASGAPGTANDALDTASGAPGTASGAPRTASDVPGTASGAPGTASDAPSTASGAPVTAINEPYHSRVSDHRVLCQKFKLRQLSHNMSHTHCPSLLALL